MIVNSPSEMSFGELDKSHFWAVTENTYLTGWSSERQEQGGWDNGAPALPAERDWKKADMGRSECQVKWRQKADTTKVCLP